MAAEDLIRELRTERQGNRPERTVYEITAEGRRALSAIREEALRRIDTPHDPFDLALAHSGDLAEEDRERSSPTGWPPCSAHESSLRHRLEYADPYLNEAERMVLRHLIGRAVAEVAWHEELVTRLPKISPTSPAASAASRARSSSLTYPGAVMTAGQHGTNPSHSMTAGQPPAAAGGGWRAVSIVLVGGVHGAARHHDRQRRAADDQDRPARFAGHAGVGRLRVRARPTASRWSRRPGRRPVRPQAAVPRRPDDLHAGQRGLRAVAETTPRSLPPVPCRAWAPGSSTRRSPPRSSCRSAARSGRRRSACSARRSACPPRSGQCSAA